MKSKSTKDASVASVVPKSGFLTFVIKQLREVLPPTLFFVIGFNLIVLTTQLILADYFIHFANFMLVTIRWTGCAREWIAAGFIEDKTLPQNAYNTIFCSSYNDSKLHHF
jgi:hypothetical protein